MGLKTINLDEDMEKELKHLIHNKKFNFSNWVRNRFKKDFLTDEAVRQRMQELDKQITEAEKEKEHLEVLLMESKERKQMLDLDSNEEKFVKTVPEKIDKGFDIKAISNFFNSEFNKNLSLREFRKLVKEVNQDG